MFRKKNGQEFMDETNLDSSTNDKEEKKGFFHRKKKKEINLYEDDMGYIEDDSNFDEDEYDKELEELQEEEKPEKKRGFFHRKKKEEEKSGGTEKLEGTKEEEESLLSDDDAIILQEPEKKKFSKKKLALICGTAAVIVIAVVFFVIRNIGGTSEGKAYVESVREITGLGTAGGANNRYTGTVDAEKSWKITLQSDLSVEKRYVNVGDQVKKGDKLYKYNTQELKLSKEKKELEQETLQNEITQLTKDIKSYQSDLKSASASEKIQLQTQILTAQTTIKKDQYTIKSNKESIKLLEKNIKDATVKSKMNGLVKKVNASLETSSSDDSSDDGSDSGDGSSDDSSYMTILAVGNYRIKGTVSETNVWSLNEGDPVIVRSRVDNSQTWKGTISSIKTDTTADDTSDSSSDYSDGYTDDESSTGETASKYNFYVKLDNDKDLMMGQHVLIEQDNGQDEQKEGMWLPSAYIKKNNIKYFHRIKMPFFRQSAFTSCTVNSPKWNKDAASAAEQPVSWNASAKSSSLPAPPLAKTGMETASQTAFSMGKSKPSFVPSASIEFKQISPAPSCSHCFTQSIKSKCISTLAPLMKTVHLWSPIFFASMPTQTH